MLYFDNLTRDTVDAYLADGMTEELTSRLGDITRLRVSGTSAVRRAQQTSRGDLGSLGRALGARYLVEGSIRRAGNSVRVAVRLLRASDGVRVWGATFDRTLTDILALQEEIAREVVTNVAGQLVPGDRRILQARSRVNPDAYVHYLRGAYLVTRRSAPGAVRAAVAEFDEALRLDPRFVAAAARRAFALGIAYAYDLEWTVPRDSIAALGRSAIADAFRLDSTASDVWMARGAGDAWYEHDLDRARAAHERAVALDPRNAEAVHTLGVTLMWLGRDSAAIDAFRRALALDPGRAITVLDLAESYASLRRDDLALPLFDSAVAMDPAQARNWHDRALARSRAADHRGARADIREAQRVAPRSMMAQLLSASAVVEASAGDTAAARRIVAGNDVAAWPPSYAARALVAVGDTARALAALERLGYAPMSWSDLLAPEFDPLRTLPRFQRLLAASRPAGAAVRDR